ncbi:MAG: hypothetical protein ACI4QM_03790 [Alphaproteobacteria bacterium]
MKKILFIAGITLLFIGTTLFGLKLMLMPILTKTLNRYAKNIDSPVLTIRFDEVTDTCVFHPCLRLDNLYVRLLDKEIHGARVQMEIPLKYPFRLHISSVGTATDPFQIEADITGNMLNIHRLTITADDFTADLTGQWDTRTNHFNADLKTNNLARFLKPYVPQNMHFLFALFLSDAPQRLKLSDSNGWLAIGGFPVLPLEADSLQPFLNHAASFSFIPEQAHEKQELNQHPLSF